MTETVDGVAMLAAPSARSRIYFDVLERHGLVPEPVLLLADSEQTAEQQRRESERDAETTERASPLPEDPQLDVSRSVHERVAAAGIEHQQFSTLDPHDSQVREAVGRLDAEYLVYSGPGGVILDADLLSTGPQFLHAHAGRLPDYRGSTTIYYSLLAERACGVTVFLMNEAIDEGPIVTTETYPPPRDPDTIDLYYDPWIRARTVATVLDRYRSQGELPTRPQDSDAGEMYYIVHPVLKHLAMLSVDGD